MALLDVDRPTIKIQHYYIFIIVTQKHLAYYDKARIAQIVRHLVQTAFFTNIFAKNFANQNSK